MIPRSSNLVSKMFPPECKILSIRILFFNILNRGIVDYYLASSTFTSNGCKVIPKELPFAAGSVPPDFTS